MKIVDINSIPRRVVPKGLNSDPKKAIAPIQPRKRIFYVIGFLAISHLMAASIWYTYQEKQELAAQKEIFEATYHFESSDFDKALEGDGTHKGFLAIIKQYPYTKTANLACFYVGSSYMHQKEYDKAIAFLKKVHFGDFILQARAWCIMGDAYSEQQDHKQAAVFYIKAAHYKENSIYTPGYLVKAAIAFEAHNRYEDAYDCYQEIVKKYPKSQYGSDLAIKEANRLSALLLMD
ncbi:tetratricopeptide repeat protein [Candidatus Cardinium hertigii]|jgi:TolA-binding protein|uniref:Cytochrome C biosynthesis protein n=1 Tax=Candidatus Cardinium hertigii TaxID=247481 RepID=A0A3N2QCA7_9BACT|nr:tetratricopeptide repeat protein [Candidatus Cardinium hertigii]ROT47453.1 cytochrome C biosynthesis protein [Candidatus Cardinium hertigii]